MDRLALVLALVLASALALAQPVDSTRRSLYKEATLAERGGNLQEAMRLYVHAARAGEPKAASRLAEIYYRGAPGVPRDYAEFLKWENAARALGERMIGDFPDRRRGY
jgi:TPR repeat protein